MEYIDSESGITMKCNQPCDRYIFIYYLEKFDIGSMRKVYSWLSAGLW